MPKHDIIASIRAGSRERNVPRQCSKEKTDNPLDLVVRDWNSSWQYTASSWHTRWDENYSLYHNTRVRRGYEGITDTFDPMTFSTVETMVAALFGSKPRFNFTPPEDKPDQNTDILNSLLDSYWDKDKWNIKVINWGRSMLMLGTGVVYLYWDTDHPCMVNVPLRDFFIDPTASSLETARYMGRRFLVTKDELKSYEVIDPETGEMKPKYSNLDKISGTKGGDGSTTDKEEKDMFYGSTIQDPENSQVEVIEYWTKDRVISIANRSTVIEDEVNYYKQKGIYNGNEYAEGIMPFAVLRDYVDESLFYATGEVDYIAGQQELLNDITNQNIDSITYTLNQMYTLDPKYAHLVNEIENLPGAVYPVEKGALVPIEQRAIPPDAFTERINIKNSIRETTASNEIIKGVGDENTTTATEINAQIAGAGQRLSLKITQIENEGFHQLATIVFAMVQLYVTNPMTVKVIGKRGVDFQDYFPEEFAGDYEPRVQLESSLNSKKNQEANIVKEMFAAFMGDPDVNQQELKRLVLQKAFDLDPDEVEGLMQVQPPMDMMGAPMVDEFGMEQPLMPEQMPVMDEMGIPV